MAQGKAQIYVDKTTLLMQVNKEVNTN